MPRDSQGNTNPLPGTIVQTGDTILPSQHNPALVDLYAMMTQSLSRDGQGGMRAPLAMNGFQVTGLGEATHPGNAVPLSQFQSGTPVGAVVDFAGVNPPDTWLLCFGQAVEVSAYPEFVAACYVGNALNATAGFGYRTTSQTDPSANRSTSGQFIVLPDMRGRVGVGKDDMGGSNANRMSDFFGSVALLLGGAMGASSHALTIQEMPTHSHSGQVLESGQHSHQRNPDGAAELAVVPTAGQTNGTVTGSPVFAKSYTETALSGRHTHTIPSDGGGLYHVNAQPSLVFNKIIKVSY